MRFRQSAKHDTSLSRSDTTESPQVLEEETLPSPLHKWQRQRSVRQDNGPCRGLLDETQGSSKLRGSPKLKADIPRVMCCRHDQVVSHGGQIRTTAWSQFQVV